MSHEMNAAYAVLGAIMTEPEAIARVAGWLQPGHFPTPTMGFIYGAMLSLWAESSSIDAVSVVARVGNVPVEANLLEFIVEVQVQSLGSTAIEHHATMLIEHDRRRRLAEWGSKMPVRLERCLYGETQAFVEEVVAELLDFAAQRGGKVERQGAAKLAAMAMDDIRRRVQARAEGRILGLPTGMRHLDLALCGLERQEFMVVTGKSSSGKSTLVGNVCLSAARARKEHVCIASLEMPGSEVFKRLLCADAHVDFGRVKAGTLSAQDLDALHEAQLRLHELDPYLSVIDRPGMTAAMMEAEAHKMSCSRGGPRLGVFACDYLQLVEPADDRIPREQQVSRISKHLLRIAREGDLCLIAVSQLNENGDIRESKAVWHDCTTWMNIDMAQVPDGTIAQPGKLKILKQRYGGTCLDGLPIVFVRPHLRFGAQEAA